MIGQTFFILALFLGTLPHLSFAQAIIYDDFPITAQIYQRDDLNRGTVTIKGQLFTDGFTDVSVLVKKDKKDFYFKKQKLTFQPGENSNAPFLLQPFITAGLVEYDFYFYAYRGRDSVLVRESTQVLCGDNIVIYGQSNAEANDATELAKFKDEFKFGRTTFANFETSDYSWFPTMKWNYYMSGLIGLEIQKQLIDKYKVPIGILNASVGNKSIDELMIRNDKNHEDTRYYYGKLVKKANKTGFSKTAKIFIWRQGESEAFEASRAEVYPTKFAQLRKQILEDFPSIKRMYVFQNNIYWAENAKAGDLREFQRKIHQLYPDCESISTVGTPGFDGLHYSFEGYQLNGLEVSRLIAKDFMSASDTLEIHSPDIKKAYFTDNRDSLVLEFDKYQKMQFPDFGIIKGNGAQAFLKDYIYLDGVSGKIAGGKAVGNKVILKLSEPISARQITYCPDNFILNLELITGIPYLTNSRGLRALTFKNFPITSNIKIVKPVLSGKLFGGVLKRISLEWSAQNGVEYSIEKSVGSPDHFSKIDVVTQGPFLDLKVKKGISYYYRLNINDEIYSNIVEIKVPLELSGISADSEDIVVYPNPVVQGSELKIASRIDAIELILSGSEGNIVQRIPVNGENVSIPTSKLRPGIYLLEAISRDNRKIIKKVVID
jgi:hypothetical protein